MWEERRWLNTPSSSTKHHGARIEDLISVKNISPSHLSEDIFTFRLMSSDKGKYVPIFPAAQRATWLGLMFLTKQVLTTETESFSPQQILLKSTTKFRSNYSHGSALSSYLRSL